MSQIKLAFVANDDNAYAPDTEIGKQIGYITWTPSKLRILLEGLNESDEIQLSQSCIKPLTIDSWQKENGSLAKGAEEFFDKYREPKVKFYNQPYIDKNEDISSIIITQENVDSGYIDIYVAGDFQHDALYGGASPEEKDIEITANCNGEHSSILTMIRVRRNANQLTTKAKNDYLIAINAINHLLDHNNKEILGTSGFGIFSTDFFKMHVKGSKSIAHGTEVFLPWHRLYILDVERQLQKINPEVSLHYWKYDEAAPNIFQDDFLGETVSDKNGEPIMIQGVSLNFAKFSDNNPLRYWAIENEKLIRRKSWFNNQIEQAGSNEEEKREIGGKKIGIGPRIIDIPRLEVSYFPPKYKMKYVLDDKTCLDGKVYLRKNKYDENGSFSADAKSISKIEGNSHGSAHMSNCGFINYVPTAAKDPLFYFLHSNVERLYTKWQQIDQFNSEKKDKNLYDYTNPNAYENLTKSLRWKDIDVPLWPWNANLTPNEYQLLPTGTRADNFTKSYSAKSTKHPAIIDAIDAFGINNIKNYLGFNYDDFHIELPLNKKQAESDTNTIIKESSLNLMNKIKAILNPDSSILNNDDIVSILKTNDILDIESALKPDFTNVLNQITFNSIFSNDFEANKHSLSGMLLSALGQVKNIEEVDVIVNLAYLNEVNDIIYQFQTNLEKLKKDLTCNHVITYYDHNTNRYNNASYSKYLTIYLTSLYDKDIISDQDRIDIFKNNIRFLSDMYNQEVLDIKIALYTFASDNTIREQIIPLFFGNNTTYINLYLLLLKLLSNCIGGDIKQDIGKLTISDEEIENLIYDEIEKLRDNEELICIIKGKLTDLVDDLKLDKIKLTDSLRNKYWALHTLLTNAGVGKIKS